VQSHGITHVYGIIDPRDRTLIYVGRSRDPQARLRQHIVEKRSSQHPLPPRLRDIIAAGLYPELVILNTPDAGDAVAAEERWIAAGRTNGYLCNVDDKCHPHATETYWNLSNALSPESDTMTAEQLRAWRTQRGWSQGLLAQSLGVSKGAVSRWESGQREISSPVAKAIQSLD
jgi:DNA-binding transcriptional regulator YiaG